MIAEVTRPAATGVTVRRMHHRHLRQVLAIEQEVYPRPWSPGLFAAELERRDSRCYLVALAPRPIGLRARLRPARVIGYAGVIIQAASRAEAAGPDAHVTTVAVHPQEHRRKVASHLLLALLEHARVRGADAATLEVRVANRGAQRLYAGFGFVPAGVRPRYYSETGEDALIMWAHGLQSAETTARLAAQAARLGEPGGASGAPDLHVPWVRGRVGLDPPAGPQER